MFSWKNEWVLHPSVLKIKPCEIHLFYLGETQTDQTSHMVKSPDLKVNGNWKQELLWPVELLQEPICLLLQF